MSAKFFLDTNVFVYTFDIRSVQKALRARELVREALDSRTGLISFQVVQEFFSVAFRRFDFPMSIPDAEQYLSSVLRPLLAVHSSSALYAHALQLLRLHRLSWYDSLILAAATQAECEVLYTEDLQHGQRFGVVQIVNPFI